MTISGAIDQAIRGTAGRRDSQIGPHGSSLLRYDLVRVRVLPDKIVCADQLCTPWADRRRSNHMPFAGRPVGHRDDKLAYGRVATQRCFDTRPVGRGLACEYTISDDRAGDRCERAQRGYDQRNLCHPDQPQKAQSYRLSILVANAASPNPERVA